MPIIGACNFALIYCAPVALSSIPGVDYIAEGLVNLKLALAKNKREVFMSSSIVYEIGNSFISRSLRDLGLIFLR